MFSLVTGLYEEYLSPKQVNLLIVGASGSGKTTLLERIKVTQVSDLVSDTTKNAPESFRSRIFESSSPEHYETPPYTPRKIQQQPPVSQFAWICPRPPTFAPPRRSEDDSSDHDESFRKKHTPARPVAGLPPPRRVTMTEDEEPIEYDLQPGAAMLPARLIRPTMGQNLKKIRIHRKKVTIWDVGGKFVDLWERYYYDADVVWFVYKLAPDDPTLEEQHALYQRVRAAVPQTTPVCVIGNVFQEQLPCGCESDVLYKLPNIPLLFLVNARTGQGVKSSLEWIC